MNRKKKICKDCQSETYIYAHGRCEHCDRVHRARKTVIRMPHRAVEPLSPKKRYNIPLRTKKRSNQEKLYRAIIKEMDDDKDKFCFFCGKVMNRAEDHHHLQGRDGALLTDRKYIVHAHRECHYGYHNNSVHKLPWFVDFTVRLAKISKVLCEKEILKLAK